MICDKCEFNYECECYSDIEKGLALLDNGLPYEIFLQIEEIVYSWNDCEYSKVKEE